MTLVALLFSFSPTNHVQAAAGDLDPTFGEGGKVATTISGAVDLAKAVAIQTDGKLIVVGLTFNGIIGDFALVRYNTDGSLDATFGQGGNVTTDFFGDIDEPFAVAIQPDGRIVVVGSALNTEGITNFALARYNADGSLDSTFGSGGKVTTDFSGNGSISDAALQADGKIVVAGEAGSSGLGDFALARYNANGSLDATFGQGGKVATDFFGGLDRANSLVIRPDGKIIAGGVASVDASFAGFALAEYNLDGSLNSTFGTGGKTTTNFFGALDFINAIALQPDGKIVAVGSAQRPSGGSAIALARYKSEGSFDLCLQDDHNGQLLQFSSLTGDYQFSDCRKGITLTGKGTVSIRGCKIELRASGRTLNVTATANPCTHAGTASVQSSSPNKTYTISDADITNNICGCR